MKRITLLTAIAVMLSLGTFAQVTQATNIPNGTNYVGFNPNSMDPLPIRNGDPRIDIETNGFTRFWINEDPTWYGLNGLQEDHAQRTVMGLNGETSRPWSILNLQEGGLNNDMYRSWYNIGTTNIANADFMYTGLLERPEPGEDLLTDAVIAWGCQNGVDEPDNFRFLFLQPNADTTDQGLETMRITPWGNVGIGRNFSNGLQPSRRLVVNERTDSAQFRIAWSVNPNPALGATADFRVSGNGNLGSTVILMGKC
jgi:hypothetical protein